MPKGDRQKAAQTSLSPELLSVYRCLPPFKFYHRNLIIHQADIKQGTFTPIKHDPKCRNGATMPG